MSNVPPPSPQYQQYPQPQPSGTGSKALIIVVSVLCVTLLLCCGGIVLVTQTVSSGVSKLGTAIVNVGVAMKCERAINASPDARSAIGKLVEAEMKTDSGQAGVLIYKVKGSTASGEIYEYPDKKTVELKMADGRVFPLDYPSFNLETNSYEDYKLEEEPQLDIPTDITGEADDATKESEPVNP